MSAWETSNCITHIAQYLIKSKGNQAKEFDQLIGYNMKNIFLEKSKTKYGGETSPRPFFERSKLSISLNQ